MSHITLQLAIDHPNLPEIIQLARDFKPVEARHQGEVLEDMVESELNPTEVQLLLALASCCPFPAEYAKLLEIAGDRRRLGSVIAGLNRRWKARGGTKDNRPWHDTQGSWAIEEGPGNFFAQALGANEGKRGGSES
ncbi:MAG: hypothetical protein OXU20_04605 [Myxococcales bacterium]|nr:hypothetical protein [Myxococcales bacterium]MDD9969683.1 hypothetical protein [Myxococcales bacterium]